MGEESERKLCPRCGESFPAAGFYRNRARSDGRQVWCRSCHLAAVTARQHENRAAGGCANDGRERFWPYQGCRECVERSWRVGGMVAFAVRDYLLLVLQQAGLCAFCGRRRAPETRNGRRGEPLPPGMLLPDHDHASGEVRALVHPCCNHRIAHNGIEDARRMVAYFERFVEPSPAWAPTA